MTLPVSIPVLLIASLIVFAGAFVQGSVGFGMGTLGVPLLLLIDPVFVPGPTLALALVLTSLVFFRERSAIRMPDLKWGVAGRLIGTVIAAGVLSALPKETTAVLIGVLVLVALVILQAGFKLAINRKTLVGIGTLSGFMGTAASIGGPPMAMLYANEKGPLLRSTMSAIFVFGTAVAVIALIVVDRFGLTELTLAGALLPAMLTGFAISHHGARLMDRGFIRPAIMVISGVAAVITIVRYAL